MDVIGRALLLLSLFIAVGGMVAALAAARGRSTDRMLPVARRALYALSLLAIGAFVILEIAFIRHDFHYPVVTGHSSLTTPLFYRMSAPWASQEGSLLLWLTLMSIVSTISIRSLKGRMREVEPYALAVLLLLGAFFAGLLVFAAQPFTTVPVAPEDGLGLSPLLRYPTMMIHPPMLYSGYTLFTVPFAFAIGALAAGKVGTAWIVHTRRYALAAWLLLGVGIILGSRWSYAELGWGGYWVWDPVENASLMPWLTATAFLHTIVVQERRGMLKIWNVSLVLVTGILCLLGTFLVRSGVLSSIHAFGDSTVGPFFLTLIAFLLITSIALVLRRRAMLQPEGRLRPLSRESMFLFGNLALIVLAIVILWGTFFPLISEALTGEASAVGPDWFTTYSTPATLAIVALAGLAPMLPWGAGRWASLRRVMLIPLLAGILAGVVTAIAGNTNSITAILMVAVAAFTISAVTLELRTGARTRRRTTDDGRFAATWHTITGNRRRYGGYLVHAGLATLLLGVAASSAFDTTRQEPMREGEKLALAGGRELEFTGSSGRIVLGENDRVERIEFSAHMRLWRNGKPAERITPSHDFYPSGAAFRFGPVGRFFEGEETTEIDLRSNPMRDLWVAATPDSDAIVKRAAEVNAGFVKILDEQNLPPEVAGPLLARSLQGIIDGHLATRPQVIVRAIDAPAVAWVWIGAIMMILGGLIAVSQPTRARTNAHAKALARVGREIGKVPVG